MSSLQKKVVVQSSGSWMVVKNQPVVCIERGTVLWCRCVQCTGHHPFNWTWHRTKCVVRPIQASSTAWMMLLSWNVATSVWPNNYYLRAWLLSLIITVPLCQVALYVSRARLHALTVHNCTKWTKGSNLTIFPLYRGIFLHVHVIW